MKKRVSSAFLAVLILLFSFPAHSLAAGSAIEASGTYDLGAFGNDSVISINSDLTVVLTNTGDISFTNMQIVCSPGVSLTVDNIKIDNRANADASTLSFAGKNNQLILAGASSVQSGQNCPGIEVMAEASLIINGSGTLSAAGGAGGPGIGGRAGTNGGSVVVAAGAVYAQKGDNGEADVTGNLELSGDAVLFLKNGGSTAPVTESHTLRTFDAMTDGGIYSFSMPDGWSVPIYAYINENNLFDLSYDANGGEGTVPETVTQYKDKGSPIAVAEGNILTKEGRAFSGWNTASDGTGEDILAGADFILTKDTALYAQYQKANIETEAQPEADAQGDAGISGIQDYLDSMTPEQKEQLLSQYKTGNIIHKFNLPDKPETMHAFALNQAYPSSYDLRMQNKVTSIKNQGTSGSCWSFATIASLESCLLPVENRDFSENNLKNNSGYDMDPNTGGGNMYMSTAYFARWGGPINETDDPYVAPSTQSSSGSVQKHVQDVLWLDTRDFATDNDEIKSAIINYGAVDISMYMGGDNELAITDGYCSYYTSQDLGTNHEVTIVGWDDSYSASNFSDFDNGNVQPAGNGAFIVKNSWGTSWGENGYFYVSYYDANFGTSGNNPSVFYNAESKNNYLGIYQYDQLGWTGYTLSSTGSNWMANVFTASETNNLSAVSFYALQYSTSYNIYVVNNYTGVGDLANKRVLAASGTLTNMGYFTVDLDSAIQVNSGKKFAVIVELSSSSTSYLPLEFPETEYSSKATASAGQSYYGGSGGASWGDITSYYPNTNFCIKAFTGKLNITFDRRDGSEPYSIAADYNSLISAPAAPSRSGYSFLGWYKESNYVNQWNFLSDRVTGNITLYAKWAAIPTAGSISAVADNKSFTVTVSNVTCSDGVSLVQLAVWSEAEGINNAKWYNASKISGTNNWRATVPLSDHANYYGKYTFRSFGFDSLGYSGVMLQTNQTITKPLVGPPTAGSISASAGSDGKSFSVTVNNVTDTDGVSLVQLAVWNESGGVGKAKWYNAAKISGTSNWQMTVPVSDFSNYYGTYTFRSFGFDSLGYSGPMLTAAQSIINSPPTAGSISAVPASDGNSFKVTVSGVSDVNGVSLVQVAAWSESEGIGQAKWYNAARVGGTSNWQVNVPVSDHSDYYGNYTFRSFGFDSLGVSGAMRTTVSSIVRQYPSADSISAAAASDGNSFTVTVNNVRDTDGVSQVQIAAWSAAEGINKAKWYNASQISGTNNWRVTVPVSDHANYFGYYTFNSFGFDTLGHSGFLLQETKSIANSPPTAISISSILSTDGKYFKVIVSGVTDTNGVSLVQIAAWSAAEGVNQAKWYNASKISGTNNWQVNVPISDHANYIGNYTFKSFGFDSLDAVGGMLSTRASNT